MFDVGEISTVVSMLKHTTSLKWINYTAKKPSLHPIFLKKMIPLSYSEMAWPYWALCPKCTCLFIICTSCVYLSLTISRTALKTNKWPTRRPTHCRAHDKSTVVNLHSQQVFSIEPAAENFFVHPKSALGVAAFNNLVFWETSEQEKHHFYLACIQTHQITLQKKVIQN